MPEAGTAEARALALFQAGRLAEAESAWRSILAAKPDDPDALHILGCILSQGARRAEGLALIDRSLERSPRNAAFLGNRARVLLESGRAEEALRDARKAVQIEPAFYAGLCQLGSILRVLGRLEEAAAALRRATAIDPRGADAHVGLGNVQRQRGEATAALASYAAALAASPANVPALYNRGSLLLEMGDYEGAEQSLRAALVQAPAHSSLLTNLGVVLRHTGRSAQARECFEHALAADARNADALNNLGLVSQEEGRLPEALDLYARAIAARPDFAPAFLNWGNALKDQGDLAGAQAKYEEALARAPTFAEALNNAAGIAVDGGRIEEGRRRYREAARAAPEMPGPRFGLAQIALREKSFAEGWEGYEERFAAGQAARRPIALPALDATNLDAVKRVAIACEQGVGDQILFSTLLPGLERRGLSAVVELDPRLVTIYRRSLPAFTFTASGEATEAFRSCDAQLSLGSLPRLLRPSVAAFAQQPHALLVPDADRVARTREQLGPGRWIAISWRSLQRGNRRAIAERKSIPLEHFARLAQCAGARLLDLQYGDVAAERSEFQARHPGMLARLEDLDTDNDFEGVIAAIAACERVVTSSNVTAHFAGAIGKETSLLFLDGFPPFHYWTAGPDARSLWYPSVRIASDDSWTDWDHAFAALCESLEA